MIDPRKRRVTLADLQRASTAGEKWAMLTAYDHPTALAAQAAGVPSLLVGDSMGNVVLGQDTTRGVPLDLLVVLGAAVRRGAPNVFFIGDTPFEAMQGGVDAVLTAAKRFVSESGCDAVKLETAPEHVSWVAKLAEAGFTTIAHLGLRPQTVETPDQYRAQARDDESIRQLVTDCRAMVDAGAKFLLLEAVPNEASEAVVEAVDVPVIGCGGGPACHGHVVVTHDMLGIGRTKPPRFVPVLGNIQQRMEDAMKQYVRDIAEGKYPAPRHVYGMRKTPTGSAPGAT